MSDRPDSRPVPPSRASARKRADTDDGTNDGTSTERRTSTQQPAITDQEWGPSGSPRGSRTTIAVITQLLPYPVLAGPAAEPSWNHAGA